MKYLVLSVFLSLFATSPVFAQTPTSGPTDTCQPIFGGGSTCSKSDNLLINKSMKSPTSDTYVDSLDPNTTFSPNQDVTFRISMTNNNNSALSKLTITDFFPAFVTFTKGPGIFDTDKRTLTINEDKLNANETKNYVISARIQGTDVFPADRPLTCLANQAQVKAGARVSSDNVQFCVKTGNQEVASAVTKTPQPTPQPTRAVSTGKPATQPQPQPTSSTTKGGVTIYPAPQTTKSPPTGPELLGLIGLLPVAGAGFYLRRKSN
jgi:uncharacterized repeat protein (TIGR01451 family)